MSKLERLYEGVISKKNWEAGKDTHIKWHRFNFEIPLEITGKAVNMVKPFRSKYHSKKRKAEYDELTWDIAIAINDARETK